MGADRTGSPTAGTSRLSASLPPALGRPSPDRPGSASLRLPTPKQSQGWARANSASRSRLAALPGYSELSPPGSGARTSSSPSSVGLGAEEWAGLAREDLLFAEVAAAARAQAVKAQASLAVAATEAATQAANANLAAGKAVEAARQSHQLTTQRSKVLRDEVRHWPDRAYTIYPP